MTALRWHRSTRSELSEILPHALVVVPVGSVEQHGPHLPTGTDTILASSIADGAADHAADRSQRPVVLTPPTWFGASDHHLPFGGTISLRPATLLAMLTDVLDSIASAGATRIVLVNGHGGNVGVCQAAAASAAVRHDVWVAHTDYWRCLPADAVDWRVPGHAGRFESALMLAVSADDVRLDALPTPARETQPPGDEAIPDMSIHGASFWHDMNGYTEDPRGAGIESGSDVLALLVRELGDRLVRIAEMG